MDVLWLSDFNLDINSGGAQRSDDILIKEGISRGHKIDNFNYNSQMDMLSREYDIIISSNLEYLHRHSSVMDLLYKHKNHYRVEHDANAYLTNNVREKLFGSTKCSFFLSSYHLDMFKSLYGKDIFPNTKIVPDPVESDLFYDMALEREDKTLFVGFMHPLKGFYSFIEHVLMSPDKEFVIAGWNMKQSGIDHLLKTFENITYLGKVEYKDMPLLYNSYNELWYKPIGFEPFCRSVAEAILCGIKLDCSNNIGCLHDYNKNGLEKFKSGMEKAQETLWDTIEEINNE